jgi:hypothetical protein
VRRCAYRIGGESCGQKTTGKKLGIDGKIVLNFIFK